MQQVFGDIRDGRIATNQGLGLLWKWYPVATLLAKPRDEVLQPSGDHKWEAVSAWDWWLVHRGHALDTGISNRETTWSVTKTAEDRTKESRSGTTAKRNHGLHLVAVAHC
ncbi:UNVERIFIED_CONTAM: hypothetical protein FKN15_022600 [Acipenser sinensis]